MGIPKGMTCSVTKLCQRDSKCAGSQPWPASEMGGKVNLSFATVALRDEGLQNPWDADVAERGSKH